MVYLDSKQESLHNKVLNLERELKKARWKLFCYDNLAILQKNNLQPGRAYSFGTNEDVLVGSRGLEKCVFDNKPLRIISPIRGGSNLPDSAVYECTKCKVRYLTPLNAQDQKAHDKRMKEVVIG